MRNVSGKCCTENQNTLLCSIIIFGNHALYEQMWKNSVEPDRPQLTIKYGPCALFAG